MCLLGLGSPVICCLREDEEETGKKVYCISMFNSGKFLVVEVCSDLLIGERERTGLAITV